MIAFIGIAIFTVSIIVNLKCVWKQLRFFLNWFDIAKIITEYKEVDFEERDDLALELQAKLRLVLRRLNYPETHREVVIDNIFDFVIQGES